MITTAQVHAKVAHWIFILSSVTLTTTTSAQEAWEFRTASNIDFKSIAFSEADLRFIAVGENEIWKTSAGTAGTWSQSVAFAPSISLNAVASDGERFIAVGNNGQIWRSEEGILWNADSIAGASNLQAIAFADGTWLAADSSGRVYRALSQPGASFSLVWSNLSSNWKTLTHGDGTWLVAGANGRVFTSENLTNWFPANANVATGLINTAHYDDGCFVVATDSGKISRSTDGGSTWEQVAAELAIVFHGLTFVNNTWLCVGKKPNGVSSSGVMYYSTDAAQSWNRLNHLPDFISPILSATAGKGEAHIVGDAGISHFSPARAALSPLVRDVETTAGSTTFEVVNSSSLATWKVTTDAAWLTPILPPDASGSGTLVVHFDALPNTTTRIGNVTLNGETVSIRQDPNYVVGGGGGPSGVPPTPTITGFNSISESSVEVSWTNSNSSAYRLRWTPGNGELTIGATQLPALVEGLTPGGQYCFEVSAYNITTNGNHASAFSSPVCYTMPLARVSGLQMTSQQLTSLGFTWNSYPNATHYVIRRDGIVLTTQTGNSYTDSNLPDNLGCTTHTYSVTALVAGHTNFPAEIELTTPLPNTAPLTAYPQSQTSIFLAWPIVTRANSYVIEYRPSTSTGTDFLPLATLPGNVLPQYIHSGLNANTRNSYRVRAVGSNSSGQFCTSADWTTQFLIETHPATPTPLEVAELRSRSVSLTWPSVSGETNFEIQRFITFPVDSNEVWTTVASPALNATSQSINQLVPGWEYNFRIRALFTGGQTAFSNTLTVIPPADPPSFASAAALSQNSIQLSWQNVFGETGYEIERQFVGSAWFTVTSLSQNISNYTDNTVLSGRAYRYRVRATLAAGAVTDWVYTSVVNALPSTPVAATATAEGANTMLLQWNSVTGASSYQVEEFQARFNNWATIGTATGSIFLHTGLAAASSHTYRVRAINASGASDWSSSFSGRTAVALSTSNISTNSVTINWSNTPSALSYRSGVKLQSNSIWSQSTHAAGLTTFTYSSLQSAQIYQFRIRADFSDGSVTTYNVVTAATLPEASASLSAVQILPNDILLSWPGVPRATSYRLERQQANANATWQPITTRSASLPTSYTDENLVLGENYTYRVVAIANEVPGAYTTSPSVTIQLPQPPSPIITQVEPDQLTISVNLPATADSVRLERQDVFQSAAGYLTRTNMTSSGLFIDTNITPGGRYRYRIVAEYAALDSPPSNPVFINVPTFLQRWRAENFGTISTIGISANDADPDFDGVSNLREFLGGSDPLHASSVPYTDATEIERLGERYIRYRFRINQQRHTVFWALQGSPDLQFYDTLIGGMGATPPGIEVEIYISTEPNFLDYSVLIPIDAPGYSRYFIQELFEADAP